jgi:hypothetical protein
MAMASHLGAQRAGSDKPAIPATAKNGAESGSQGRP